MNEAPATPRRRWLRFSLRTLFVVVTLIAVWLGYNLNWIRHRHAFLAEQARLSAIRDQRIREVSQRILKQQEQQDAADAKKGIGTVVAPKFTYMGDFDVDGPRAPGLLWLFGEEGVGEVPVYVFAGETATATMERGERLFPEAHVQLIEIPGKRTLPSAK